MTGRCCIVNVDDFGMSHGVNRAVIEAHQAGIVTSASLMVDLPGAAEAAALAGKHPELSVGLHLNLTNESGPPVVALDDVAAVEDELLRQLALFESLVGHPPTHLDSHHHIHRRRALTATFRSAAATLGVPLRDEPGVTFWGSFYAQWDDATHPEQVSLDSLTAMLGRFHADFTELATHAAYVDDDLESSYRHERELELRTLLDPALPSRFEHAGLRLVGFGDLPALGWQVPPAA